MFHVNIKIMVVKKENFFTITTFIYLCDGVYTWHAFEGQRTARENQLLNCLDGILFNLIVQKIYIFN